MNKKYQDKLLKLQQNFTKGLPERIGEIISFWDDVQHKKNSALSSFEKLYLALHSLSGTAPTMGFAELGTRARDIEQSLAPFKKNGTLPTGDSQIGVAIYQLHRYAITNPVAPPTLDSRPKTQMAEDKHSGCIYILELSPSTPTDILEHLHTLGYNTSVFSATEDLNQAIEKLRPDALIVDYIRPGSGFGNRPTLPKDRKYRSDIPIIYITENDSWQDRLNAVRAGCDAYYTKPVDFDDLLEQLDRLCGNNHEEPYHVLIIDDENLLTEHYSAILQSAGMKTLCLNKADAVFDVIGDFSPDLILMDLYMPDCTGIEAAQIIRQQSAYTNIPIVYLSAEQDIEQQLAALQVGGDDFLIKPIGDKHLEGAVKIRAKRFRQLTKLMDRDSLTGLLNHTNLKLALDRELSRAQRQNTELSFVMIDIDHFKSVNDLYGHPVGDKVIKGISRLLNYRFRKTDICGRYGGEEFAIILPDTPVEKSRELIDDLRKSFASTLFSDGQKFFSSTFSAGIATFPSHNSVEALIASADETLYKAKQNGRNCVLLESDTISRQKVKR